MGEEMSGIQFFERLVQQQLSEIRGELKEGMRRIDERIGNIEEVCKCREERIRHCEDAILKAMTITTALPYFSRVLWCVLGIAAAKLLPLILSIVPKEGIF